MAGVSIQITIEGAIEMAQLVQQIRQAVADSMGDIGEHLLESTRQRFVDEQDPDNKAWEKLKPSTKEKKSRNANRILLEFGGLMDSIHPKTSANSVELGSNVIYAATHQFGADERNIPARPFLGVSTDDETAIVDIITEQLKAMTH